MDIDMDTVADAGNEGISESSSISTPGSVTVTPKLLNRIMCLEQQVKACIESQPLLYQVFSKCNALEQKMKVMKKDIDRCLAELVLTKAGGDDESYSRRRTGFQSIQRQEQGDNDLVSSVSVTSSRLRRMAYQELDEEEDERREEENELGEDQDDDEDWTPDLDYECSSTSTNVGAHVVEADTKPYECKFCDGNPKQLFDSAEGLANHYSTQHSQDIVEIDPQFGQQTTTISDCTCPKCSKEFRNKWGMQRHLETMHAPPRFPCSICGHRFRRQDIADRHKEEIHERRSTTADTVAVAPWRKHPSTKTVIRKGPKPKACLKPWSDKCDKCGGKFYSKQEFLFHQETAHREEDMETHVVCTLCGKRMAKNNLRRHMVVHTGLKPHVCEVCGARFRDKHDLHAHSSRHTGVKPFMCDECGWSSSKASYLVRHKLRSHVKSTTKKETEVIVREPDPLASSLITDEARSTVDVELEPGTLATSQDTNEATDDNSNMTALDLENLDNS